MRAQDAYISQIQTMTDEINSTLDEMPEDQINRRPGPSLNPVGWNYWHLLRIWDLELNVLIQGRDPSEDSWHRGNFTATSGYNPDGKGARNGGTGMGYSDAEVDEVQIPLAIIREYQQFLQHETEEYLRNADDAELNRMTTFWRGETTCSKVVEQMIRNGWMHYGEIRYAKGMLGYPDPSYPGSDQ